MATEKRIVEEEFVCMTCGRDFDTLESAEKHSKDTNHDVFGSARITYRIKADASDCKSADCKEDKTQTIG